MTNYVTMLGVFKTVLVMLGIIIIGLAIWQFRKTGREMSMNWKQLIKTLAVMFIWTILYISSLALVSYFIGGWIEIIIEGLLSALWMFGMVIALDLDWWNEWIKKMEEGK